MVSKLFHNFFLTFSFVRISFIFMFCRLFAFFSCFFLSLKMIIILYLIFHFFNTSIFDIWLKIIQLLFRFHHSHLHATTVIWNVKPIFFLSFEFRIRPKRLEKLVKNVKPILWEFILQLSCVHTNVLAYKCQHGK